MPISIGYKLAAGAVVAAGIGIYLFGKRPMPTPSANTPMPGVGPASPPRSPWASPPPSAFLATGPVTRSLSAWEKSVLSAYYRPDLLERAILHIGQWESSGASSDADFAALTRGR